MQSGISCWRWLMAARPDLRVKFVRCAAGEICIDFGLFVCFFPSFKLVPLTHMLNLVLCSCPHLFPSPLQFGEMREAWLWTMRGRKGLFSDRHGHHQSREQACGQGVGLCGAWVIQSLSLPMCALHFDTNWVLIFFSPLVSTCFIRCWAAPSPSASRPPRPTPSGSPFCW